MSTLGDRRGVFRAERASRAAPPQMNGPPRTTRAAAAGARGPASLWKEPASPSASSLSSRTTDFLRAGVGVAPGLTLGAFERLRHLAQFSSTVPRSIL